MADQKTQHDPWEQEAAAFNGAPSGSPAAPAGDDWKIWQHGPDDAPQGNQGFFGPIQDAYDDFVKPMGDEQRKGSPGAAMADDLGRGVMKAFGDPVMHPVQTAEGMARSVTHPASAAKNMAHSIAEDPNRAVPEFLGGIGGAGLAAPLAEMGGAGIAKVAEAIPTKAKAGKLFESVMQDAKDQPVTISPATMEPLERTQQLSSAGGKPFGTADKLYQRLQQINPVTYGEARDFAQNMSLTPEEQGSLKRSMKYEVPRLSRAFNEDVGRAATAAGRGEDYAKAMRDYSRAARINNFVKQSAKFGVGAAGVGAVDHYIRKAMQ